MELLSGIENLIPFMMINIFIAFYISIIVSEEIVLLQDWQSRREPSSSEVKKTKD
jgi:capsular polysaccharide biosynthesis protein